MITLVEIIEAIERPEPIEDVDLDSPNYFDPWDFFPCVYGGYSSAFDQCAIQVLEEIHVGRKCRRDLGAEMFREMLCTADLCDYGMSPRHCFANPDFAKVLPELIEKWKRYYKVAWNETYIRDENDV